MRLLFLGALVGACTTPPAPTAPTEAPLASELVGSWALTVESHRLTGKRYGMPANLFALELGGGGEARWADLPAPLWRTGADVLDREEGAGSWEPAERQGRWQVVVRDETGEHLVGIWDTPQGRTLALDETGAAAGADRRLWLVRAP